MGGVWGFQQLNITVPVLSAAFTFDEFDESCALDVRQDPNDFIREGFLGLFFRAMTPDDRNDLNLADMTIGIKHHPVTVRFSRWMYSSAKPVRIWLEELGLAVSLNNT